MSNNIKVTRIIDKHIIGVSENPTRVHSEYLIESEGKLITVWRTSEIDKSGPLTLTKPTPELSLSAWAQKMGYK